MKSACSKLIACPTCGHNVSRNAAACPGCGEVIKTAPTTTQRVPMCQILFISIGIFFVLVGITMFVSEVKTYGNIRQGEPAAIFATILCVGIFAIIAPFCRARRS